MVEYVCDMCDSVFELYKYSPVQRCPECLEWDAHPVYEPREGEIYGPWGEISE